MFVACRPVDPTCTFSWADGVPAGWALASLERAMRKDEASRVLRREQIWEELLTILMDKHDGDVPADLLRKSLLQNKQPRTTLDRSPGTSLAACRRAHRRHEPADTSAFEVELKRDPGPRAVNA